MENKDPKVTQAAEKVVDDAADAIKLAAKAADTKPAKPAKRTGAVKTYTSDRDVYVDNLYTKAGEVFTTNAIPAEHWTERKPAEVAAIEGSTNLVPNDANLEEASAAALEAVAIMHKVSIVGIAGNKKALISAIKAANDPTR